MHSLAWTEYAIANMLYQYKPTCNKENSCLFAAGLCCKTGARLNTDSLKCKENAIRKQQQHVSNAGQPRHDALLRPSLLPDCTCREF